jgi:hypothetical protein
MTDFVEAAKEALKRPSDFGWHGREDMFVSWGITGPHRYPNGGGMSDEDSILNDSNFFSIQKHLQETFPDSENIEEVGINHWAMGSVDSITCKVIATDPPEIDDLTEDDLTPEFKEITSILWSLRDDYPIFDEMDHSERESEYRFDLFCDYLPFEVDKDMADDIYTQLHDDGFDVDYDGVDEEDILEVAYSVGADDRKLCDEEWQAWEFLNPGALSRRIEKKWIDAGQLQMLG